MNVSTATWRRTTSRISTSCASSSSTSEYGFDSSMVRSTSTSWSSSSRWTRGTATIFENIYSIKKKHVHYNPVDIITRMIEGECAKNHSTENTIKRRFSICHMKSCIWPITATNPYDDQHCRPTTWRLRHEIEEQHVLSMMGTDKFLPESTCWMSMHPLVLIGDDSSHRWCRCWCCCGQCISNIDWSSYPNQEELVLDVTAAPITMSTWTVITYYR